MTIVKNPKEPMYGEDVFSLEEELSIGEAEGREEYMFSQIRSIAVDDVGRIYVLDAREAHVEVFDQDRSYIRTIGRKGQGPGELSFPLSLFITPQNELVVEDFNSRLAFFSLEGEFKKNLLIAKVRLVRIDIDSEGSMVGIVIVREEENPRYELKKFDSDLNYLHSLGSSPLPSARDGSINPFMGIILSQIDNNDQIICGYPEKYEIKIFDKEGKLKRKIMKEYDPVEITEEEIEEETEGAPPDIKLSIPKYHTAYSWFKTDDEGRIFIRTWERAAEREGNYYDVFDSEGKCISKILLKTRPFVLKNKKLYTVEEDEEGFLFIKRYKVTWKY
ncbi:MAG: 6-bladed beta-propeller [Candidatus Aminicenantes bacterium]|nr:6-bladed beta-propeller [Candidatus Aminicenantes bacterium]